MVCSAIVNTLEKIDPSHLLTFNLVRYSFVTQASLTVATETVNVT